MTEIGAKYIEEHSRTDEQRRKLVSAKKRLIYSKQIKR